MKTQIALLFKTVFYLLLFLAVVFAKAEIPVNDTTSPAALSFLQAPPDAAHFNYSQQRTLTSGPGYGYGNNVWTNELYAFDSNDLSTLSVTTGLSVTSASGDFHPDDAERMWMIDINSGTLHRFDINTGVSDQNIPLLLPLPDGVWTVLAIDKASGEFYGVATNGEQSELYLIDPVSGALTDVLMLEIPTVISGTFDGLGSLYLFDINLDEIWVVDLLTNNVALLGSAGFDGNFAQGMGYDSDTDRVFLSAYNNTDGPELRLLDRLTGATTLVGALPGETTGFGFPAVVEQDDFLMAGQDYYTVPAGNLIFGEDLPAIPEGFFEPGSLPFEGPVVFKGAISDGGQLPQQDLKINRSIDMPLVEPLPSTGYVPIEIVELNLTSVQPINVGNTSWLVEMHLTPTMPQQGNAYITKENLNGGNFYLDFILMPVFVFTSVDNPSDVRFFQPSEFGYTGLALFSAQPFPWMAPPIPHEFDPFWDGGMSLYTQAGSEIILVPLLKRQDNAFLSMDEEGIPELWEGTGYNNSEWFRYPNFDWWNVWFYDHPLDVTRRKIVSGVFDIVPRDPSQPSYVEVIVGWSTTEWPSWAGFPYDASPPLPGDVIDPIVELQMIERSEAIFEMNGFLEETQTVTIPSEYLNNETGLFNFNPEWIFIDVRGYNFMIYGELDHICFKPWPTCEVICPEDMEVCATDEPFTLSGASPAGGTYSGNGVSDDGTFDPGNASWGDNTITYSYVCPDGTVVTCTFIIHVIPPPEMVCPPDMAVCLSDLIVSIPSGMPGGGTFSGPGMVGGNSFSTIQAGIGTHTITYSVTEPCPGSCTFSITVHPNPEVDCPDDFEMCESDDPIDLMTLVTPTGGTFTGGQMFDPGTSVGGPWQIKYTYTDPVTGCTGSCVFYITVHPNPEIECPADFTMCEDDASIDLMGLVSPAGGTFTGGQIFDPSTSVGGPWQIKYTYTDPVTGCTGSCVFYITVLPSPEMDCPPDMEFCLSDGVVTLPSGSPAGGSLSGSGMVGGNSFSTIQAGVGTHTITYTVTDPCPGSCTFTITVHPNPEVDCPDDFEMCESDNSIDLMTLVSPQGGTFTGGQMFDPGSSVGGPWQIKYTYTDPLTGCTGSCVFYITVHPNPEVICPDDFNMCEDDPPIDMMTLVSPQGGSFGGGQIYDPSTAPLGVPIQIKYTYTDPVTGCTGSCIFYITVWPNPDVECPDDMEMCVDDGPVGLTASPAGGTFSGPGISGNSFKPGDAGVGTHTIEYCYTDPQTGCEGCCEFTIVVHPLPDVNCPPDMDVCIDDAAFALTGATPVGGTYSDLAGNPINNFDPVAAGVGMYVVYYDYTDPVTGCSNYCVFIITVHPLPIVTCPANKTVCYDDPAFALTGATPAGGVYSDAFGIPIANFNPAAWGVGLHPILYDYTDPNTGCSNLCSFTIIVLPLPVATCPANMTVCIDVLPFGLAGGAPLGGIYAGVGVGAGVFNPVAAGVGVHIITYTYTDPATGCSNSCTFTITVDPLPVVTCPGNMRVCIYVLPFGLAGGAPLGGIYAGAGVGAGVFNPVASGVGVHIITYTYTDPATGCSNSCTFTITVDPLPVVTCPPNMTVCVDALPFGLAGGAPAGGTYSGPGVAGGMFNPLIAGAGLRFITYNYVDPLTGCHNSCIFSITVNPLPVVVCPPDITVNISDAPFLISGATPTGGVYTDAMNNVITTFSPAVAGLGSHAITYRYTDTHGCSNSCVFIITVIDQAFFIDFGDAPDDTLAGLNYHTLLASNGARHIINSAIFMGDSIDAEFDGQPTLNADGDDINTSDDEDGVVLPVKVYPGSTNAITVKASIDGFLDAWMDFNMNGNWTDAGEHIFVSQPLTAGMNALVLNVPAGALYGVSYLRFRFRDNAAPISHFGLVQNGEVEDHYLLIDEEQVQELDFGDAPGHITGFDYHTRMVNNGARHIIDQDVFLGNLIDAEFDGQPTLSAKGDDLNNVDDEDGVVFTRRMAVGSVAKVKVKASVDGYLNAWVDFDMNGTWAEAGDQIFTDQLLTAGWNMLTFNIPAGIAPTKTYARFRFNTSGGLSYDSLAMDGEVEDYRIAIYPENWAVSITDLTHMIVVPISLGQVFFAVEDFTLMPEDFVGVFFYDQGDTRCGGAIQWDGTGNQTLTAFGDDPLTPQKDGFQEGENFRFKVHRPSTGETFNVETTFDPELPDTDGAFHNNGFSGLTEVIHNGLSQTLDISEGWSGISTYLEPLNNSVSSMFAPVIDDLHILYNLEGVFWPGQNFNSIGSWNEHSGYVTKLTKDASLTISGNELFDMTVNLSQGWNIVPVLSQVPYDAELLFSSLPGFVLAKEIAGMGVYLPAYGINTIGDVMPGSSYYVLTNEAGTITYFSNEVKASTVTNKGEISNISSPFSDVTFTPESHIVVFNLADSPLMQGDVIAAFTTTDQCAGLVLVEDGKFALTVNGDDSYTESQTGFVQGESLYYKLYRSATDEILDLEVSYNPAMTPGIFKSNGLSEVVEIKAFATGVPDVDEYDIRIYPNPSSGIFNISGVNGETEIIVLDVVGKVVMSGTFALLQSIDLTGKPEGIYFVKIKTQDGFESTRKLIIH